MNVIADMTLEQLEEVFLSNTPVDIVDMLVLCNAHLQTIDAHLQYLCNKEDHVFFNGTAWDCAPSKSNRHAKTHHHKDNCQQSSK